MRYRSLLAVSAIVLASPIFAQIPVDSAALPATQPVLTASPLLLRQDTPVELMAVKEVSTADTAAGARFKLRVNKAVSMEGKVVIPVGSWAFGEVIAASDSGGLGKSGRMTARLLYVQTGDAQIPLSGEVSAKGTGAGSAGLAILFTGWAGFFHRGNNAKIKAGEILTGFIAENAWLDLGANPVKRVSAPAVAQPGTQLISSIAPTH